MSCVLYCFSMFVYSVFLCCVLVYCVGRLFCLFDGVVLLLCLLGGCCRLFVV